MSDKAWGWMICFGTFVMLILVTLSSIGIFKSTSETALPWYQDSCSGVAESSPTLSSLCCISVPNTNDTDIVPINCTAQKTQDAICSPGTDLWCSMNPPIRATSQITSYAELVWKLSVVGLSISCGLFGPAIFAGIMVVDFKICWKETWKKREEREESY